MFRDKCSIWWRSRLITCVQNFRSLDHSAFPEYSNCIIQTVKMIQNWKVLQPNRTKNSLKVRFSSYFYAYFLSTFYISCCFKWPSWSMKENQILCFLACGPRWSSFKVFQFEQRSASVADAFCRFSEILVPVLIMTYSKWRANNISQGKSYHKGHIISYGAKLYRANQANRTIKLNGKSCL
jgi:hypothetical protein